MKDRSKSTIRGDNSSHGVDSELMTSQVAKWKGLCLDRFDRIYGQVRRHVGDTVKEEFKRFEITGFQTLVR